MNASTRQTWAIFCASKFDVRACNLSNEKASELLSRLNGEDRDGALSEIAQLEGAVCKGKPSAPRQDFRAIYERAIAAGMEAGKACRPAPMLVQQHANVLDDNSEVTKQWLVPEGVCGFAWVNVKPGTHSFAKWLKDNDLGRRDSYSGGVTLWANEFGQSYERKVAFANAVSKVLNTEISGIRAYTGSRLD